jgi:hypothetical protein
MVRNLSTHSISLFSSEDLKLVDLVLGLFSSSHSSFAPSFVWLINPAYALLLIIFYQIIIQAQFLLIKIFTLAHF